MNKIHMSIDILRTELVNTTLFSCLEPVDLTAISNFCEIWSYEPAEKIIMEDEFNKGFYVLLSGKLEIVKSGKNGAVRLSVLKNNAAFGETALFKNEKATATVIALEQSVIAIISKEQFAAYIDVHPKAGNVILTYVALSLLQKLKLANEELVEEYDLEFSSEDMKTIMSVFYPVADGTLNDGVNISGIECRV